MSAIVGIFHRDGRPVEPERLQSMVDILEHRGSDWAQAWQEGAVGLGNRMLWITKLSCREQMPSWDATRNTIITADCRLDNREELWRTLECQGHPLDEMTDSALILLAYARWGQDCPEHLIGDFAFTIWDRVKRRIFCARDHMGVKPFYYHLSDKRFAFASEIKGLLQLEDVDRTLDEDWIGDYLTVTHGWTNKKHTVYRSIRRLEPAHTLVLDGRDVQIRRYWGLDPDRRVAYASDEEYFEGFRSRFFEAVRCRMESLYPVGSMLSGGLDSSAITCVARSLSDSEKALHSFSGVFPSIPQCDESSYINTVLAQNGLQSHCIDASVVGTLHEFERKLWHFDQPLPGYFSQMSWLLYGHARDSGVRVILDGLDGDTTVYHGFGYYNDLCNAGNWRTLLPELYAHGRIHGSPVMRRYLSKLCRVQIANHVPESIKRIRRRIRSNIPKNDQSPHGGDQLWERFKPEFVRSARLKEKEGKWIEDNRSQTARERHWAALNSNVLPMVLELWDSWGSAFGLRLRFPFCDRRLVEYCLAVPTRLKCHRGLGRYIMREALRDVLPKEIAKRPGKARFGDVLQLAWEKHDCGIVRSHLDTSLDAISDYIDPSYMKEKYRSWEGRMPATYEARAFSKSMLLGLWVASERA